VQHQVLANNSAEKLTIESLIVILQYRLH